MIHNIAQLIEFQLRRMRVYRTFKKKSGFCGDFENPKCYEEKIQFRKLYGNAQTYANIADKFKVRQFVKDRVGEQYLTKLYCSVKQLRKEMFDDFPDSFVVKANHGCKWNRFVKDKSNADVDELVKYFNSMTSVKYGNKFHEVHYNIIDPMITVEELLLDDDHSPWDYNIFSYNNGDEFNYAVTIVPDDGKSIAHFDQNWNVLPDTTDIERFEKYISPENFDDMIRVARELSRGFDFIRVDLYNVNGKIYFGELTATPAAGYGRPLSPERQAIRSDLWHLDVDNRHLYRKPRKLFGLYCPS